MKLKKKTKEGTCDAMRCKEDYAASELVVATDGVILCPVHARGYTPEAPPPVALTLHIDDLALLEIDVVHAQAEEELAALGAFVINSQEGLDLAGELLREVKGKINKLETDRKSVTKPLNDTKREIDGRVKPVRDALEAVETALKMLVAGYLAQVEAAKLEALKAGQHDEALAMGGAVMPAGVSTRAIWRYRIPDVNKLPRQYMVPDSGMIQTIVNTHKEKTAIPGVEVYQDVSVAAKGTVGTSRTVRG